LGGRRLYRIGHRRRIGHQRVDRRDLFGRSAPCHQWRNRRAVEHQCTIVNGVGIVFRRVNVRRYKARPAVRGRRLSQPSGREPWDLRKTRSTPVVPARIAYDAGTGALHPASVGPIYRSIVIRAFDGGALVDLTSDDLAWQLSGISAHSTRVGLNQDLFASGEDIAGIMDALRCKSPRMPLAYNRNLAAEQGAAGRLMSKLA
jgi:hypothetical protein